MARTYVATVRILDGVQHESLRRAVDAPFNEAHDELSAAYYEGRPFRDYGILDKSTFDGLHASIWHQHTVALHTANADLPVEQRAALQPEDLDIALAELDKLAARGLVLAIVGVG